MGKERDTILHHLSEARKIVRKKSKNSAGHRKMYTALFMLLGAAITILKNAPH